MDALFLLMKYRIKPFLRKVCSIILAKNEEEWYSESVLRQYVE